MKIDLFPDYVIKPFEAIGWTSTLLHINIDTLVYTWVALAIMFAVLIKASRDIREDKKTLFALGFEALIEMFAGLCSESIGYFSFDHFAFVSSVFLFTLFGTIVGIVPFIEEATKDLNTTLALGLSCFVYVQYQHIRAHGFVEYLKDYAKPFIFMLPLEVIGRVASIISMSFRLFGNILGGYIIYTIAVSALAPYKLYFIVVASLTLLGYWIARKMINLTLWPKLSMIFNSLLIGTFSFAMAQVFFGLIEGAVQAFVLTMLTITYLAIAAGRQEGEEGA